MKIYKFHRLDHLFLDRITHSELKRRKKGNLGKTFLFIQVRRSGDAQGWPHFPARSLWAAALPSSPTAGGTCPTLEPIQMVLGNQCARGGQPGRRALQDGRSPVLEASGGCQQDSSAGTVNGPGSPSWVASSIYCRQTGMSQSPQSSWQGAGAPSQAARVPPSTGGLVWQARPSASSRSEGLKSPSRQGGRGIIEERSGRAGARQFLGSSHPTRPCCRACWPAQSNRQKMVLTTALRMARPNWLPGSPPGQP